MAEWDYSLTPRKDPVHRVEADAKRNWPGMTMLEARVDEVAAMVITSNEAKQRMGEGVDPATGNDPVWWVRVRGYFRYSANGSQANEALERYFVYDGTTGDFIAQWTPPATPTPAATSCPEAFDPAQTNVHVFPPERWSPNGLLPANDALAKASDGKVYTIYAGGQPDDTFQGAVVIAEGVPDACAEVAAPIHGTLLVDPVRGGAVRVVQVDRDLALLETTERHQIWLDFVTHQFGEVVAPGVVPPTPDP